MKISGIDLNILVYCQMKLTLTQQTNTNAWYRIRGLVGHHRWSKHWWYWRIHATHIADIIYIIKTFFFFLVLSIRLTCWRLDNRRGTCVYIILYIYIFMSYIGIMYKCVMQMYIIRDEWTIACAGLNVKIVPIYIAVRRRI